VYHDYSVYGHNDGFDSHALPPIFYSRIEPVPNFTGMQPFALPLALPLFSNALGTN